MQKKNVANVLTSFRLVGSLGLIFLEPLSVAFYVLYSLCGLTDALDGAAARKWGGESEFGARLDSVADFTFYTVMMVKVLPRLLELLPQKFWICLGGVAAARVVSYTVAAVKFRRFASQHTWLNKLTGLLVFGVPYLMGQSWFAGYAWLVWTAAALGAAEELTIHITSREYRPERKSLWERKKEA